jgi:hypothetical protein
MRERSVEAELADLVEASVELDTVWREILRPGRSMGPDEGLMRRHEAALQQVLDADEELRRKTGLGRRSR